ncbi:MAG: HEAT repeat domain-containing protein [Phycisphaerales bacterium]|nr:HEAT repeat domain-containing protein [Phycisphaerales bacterium]
MSDDLFPSADVAPYTLPLNKAAFERAVTLGHGRAWEHAKAHGIEGHEAFVEHATLHSLAYDTQCEGDRAQWMVGLIEAAGALDRLAPRIIEGVATPPEGDYPFWHLCQRAGVMGELARRGYGGARSALYGLFDKSKTTVDLIGGHEIIALDGSDGLLFVCDALGRLLARDPDTCVDQQPIRVYDETHGDGAAMLVLESARGFNGDIARYLDRLHADEVEIEQSQSAKGPYLKLADVVFDEDAARRREGRYADRTLQNVLEWVNANRDVRYGGWLRAWGMHNASDDDLDGVIGAIEGASDPRAIQLLLCVFGRRAMPRITDEILALCRHDDEWVRRRVYQALSNCDDERVREVGLSLLGTDRVVEGAISLFEASYRVGDHEAIERAMRLVNDRDDLHRMLFDLVDVFETRSIPECRRLLMFVYGHTPCGNCRGKAIEIMRNASVLPDWIASEARNDSQEDIREEVGDGGS